MRSETVETSLWSPAGSTHSYFFTNGSGVRYRREGAVRPFRLRSGGSPPAGLHAGGRS